MEGFACDLYTSTTNVKILVVTGILGRGTTKIQISRSFVHQADCFSEETYIKMEMLGTTTTTQPQAQPQPQPADSIFASGTKTPTRVWR